MDRLDRFLKTDRFFGCIDIRAGSILLGLFEFTVLTFQLVRIIFMGSTIHAAPIIKEFDFIAASPVAAALTTGM